MLGTVLALNAGCPGAQVRPEPFECPADAWAWMERMGWTNPYWGGSPIALDVTVGAKPGWLQTGPVVGVGRVLGFRDTKKPAPKGTLFFGHLWVVPEKRERGIGYVVARYDRVRFPNGEEAPVCLLAGQNKELWVEKIQGGRAWVPVPAIVVDAVQDWNPRPRD